MIGATILFAILANFGPNIGRIDGVIFLIAFIAFLVYTIKLAKKSQAEEKETIETNNKNANVIMSILKIVLGIVLLKFGGDISVDNAVIVARNIGISEKIIGLTIVAIGTSLPELITSVVAAFKKNADIAIGNIVGSNIFNILFIIGVSAVISPINYAISYNVELIWLLVACILLLCFAAFGKKDVMTRKNGITYLIIYALYIASLIS